MMKQMSSPGGNVGGVVGGVGGVGSVGGVGGVGGGVFPPQISPQQLAMLSNIYPHMQQFHLVGDLTDIDVRHYFFYFLSLNFCASLIWKCLPSNIS